MDTEEARKIEEHAAKGRPETDEGPYYHEAWWEAYKGNVKGMFGGLVIGGGIGLLAGGIATAVLALGLGVGITMGIGAGIVLGFSGLGALFGAHEFGNVGTVTGAVAAAHEKSEERMKEFTDSRFAQIKREIAGLKAAITGGKTTPEMLAAEAAVDAQMPSCAEVDARQDGYRTHHCDETHCGERQKLVFPVVAGIGALTGAAAGALLGYGDLFHEFLQPLHHAGLSGLASAPAGAVVGGALGATFGVNRDVFRGVFDTTDRLFKGIVISKENGRAQTPAVAMTPSQAKGISEPDSQVRILVEPHADEPSTRWVDRRQKELEMGALLALNPTTAKRQ